MCKKNNEAHKYLSQVEMIDTKVQNKLVEQRMWKDVAMGITANMGGERVKSSGSKSRMADALDKCADVEAEIDALIDELIDTKKDVIQTIEKLDNPTFYNILHLRYIQYKPLWKIAEDYDKDYGWIKTNHGRAISEVQKILERKKFVTFCAQNGLNVT